MIQAMYHELDGPAGVTRRLSVKGHANYAPAGQDIVCAGASILMQALVWLTAGADGVDCTASDGPEGPRIAVTAAPGKNREESERLAGSFELAKAGLALLAERYPDNLRFADTSRRGEEGMVDLQLFAKKEERKPPALSRAQERQAKAAGTIRRKREEAAPAAEKPEKQPAPKPEAKRPVESMLGIGEAGRFIRWLHRRWALVVPFSTMAAGVSGAMPA